MSYVDREPTRTTGRLNGRASDHARHLVPVYGDLGAERALLGYLIGHPSVAKAPPLSSDHFADPDLRRVYETVITLATARNVVDPIALADALRSRGMPNASLLVEGLIEDAGVDYMALVGILDDRRRRRLLNTLSRFMQSCAEDLTGNLHDRIQEMRPQFDAVVTPIVPTGLGFVDDVAILAQADMEYLVDGLIPSRSISLLVGAPGSAKTFLALDMSCSIAANLPWHDRAVKRGPVVFVAAEGQGGLGRRVAAWKRRHGFEDQHSLGVHFLLEPLDLFAEEQVAALGSQVRRLPQMPVLIVIDTWAICLAFGGGDENQARDVGRALANLRRLVLDLGATVLLVHHEGHAAPGRGRGSSALRAGVDAELTVAVEEGGTIVVRNSKQRDAERAAELGLRICVQELPDHKSSCVLEDASVPDRRVARKEKTGAQDAALLAALMGEDGPLPHSRWQQASCRVWQQGCGAKLSDSTFSRVRKRLLADGYVERDSAGMYAATPKGREYCHHHQNARSGGSDSGHEPLPPPSPPSLWGDGCGGGAEPPYETDYRERP